jgi:hypothetical protein
MPSIDRTAEYDASPAELWAIIADLPAWPEWLTILRSWTSEPPATLEVGTTLDGAIAIMSIPMAVSWRVDACDEPHSLSISGVAVLNSKVSLEGRVEQSGVKSTFQLHVQIENPMLVGALAESLMNAVQRDIDTSMANFRERLSPR